jgi:hypothetical protein
MDNFNRRRNFCLGLSAVFFAVFSLSASAIDATGDFEVYCDGVGLFLSNTADAPGKLVLVSRVDFPPGTMGDRYIGQGKWSDVVVLPDGCVPDGKCKGIAKGKVWIDVWDTEDALKPVPKRISGKYEIDLNGNHLAGRFVARERSRKDPLRLCM